MRKIKLLCLVFCVFSFLIAFVYAEDTPIKKANLFTELKLSLYGDIHFPTFSSYNVAGVDLGIFHPMDKTVLRKK